MILPKFWISYHESRFTNHVSRITFHESRFTNHVSRITHHESRITNHASLITNHASLCADWTVYATSLLSPFFNIRYERAARRNTVRRNFMCQVLLHKAVMTTVRKVNHESNRQPANQSQPIRPWE